MSNYQRKCYQKNSMLAVANQKKQANQSVSTGAEKMLHKKEISYRHSPERFQLHNKIW